MAHTQHRKKSTRNSASSKRPLRDRDQLIVEYQKFVHGLVGKFVRSFSLPTEQTDEYIAAGYLGLVEAAERYDPGSGVAFSNFAYLRIRGAVIDCIRESTYLSAKAQRLAKSLQAAHQLREAELLGTKREERAAPDVATVLDSVAKGALVHRLTGATAEEALSRETAVSQTPEVILQQEQRRAEIREWVSTLPEKERLVIEDYYFKGKSFVDIANGCEGMSKSWVSRLHARALEQLKERIVFQGVKPLPCEVERLSRERA